MKPKNFPGRRFRRQARALLRATGAYPDGFVEQSTDVRIRVGAKKRDQNGQVRA